MEITSKSAVVHRPFQHSAPHIALVILNAVKNPVHDIDAAFFPAGTIRFCAGFFTAFRMTSTACGADTWENPCMNPLL
jgi:hypothetical protein